MRVNAPVGIFIPTLNATGSLDRIATAIEESSVPMDNVYVIDSASTDGTVEKLDSIGIKHSSIERNDFTHGKVRRLAVKYFENRVEYIIMATQDVLFSGQAIDLLIDGILSDEKIGVSYMRQISTKNNSVEYYDRQFNYPPKSLLKNASMIPKLGATTYFSSDAFSIYRISALIDVGNFPADVSFAEDVYIAAKLILAGWSIYYNADSYVIHNNISSYSALFHRYYSIGEFYHKNSWLKKQFGGNQSNGIKLVIYELKQSILRHSPHLLSDVVISSAIKLIAYRLPHRNI